MPPAAQQELVEWGPAKTPEAMMALLLAQRVPIGEVVPDPPTAPEITDNRPFTEYFLLRRNFAF
jgi:hypothetical protein